jgi:nitroreductase
VDAKDPSVADFGAIVGRRTRGPAGRTAVGPALLGRVLRLATLAPSAYNLQPWRFLVVRDAVGRRAVVSCALERAGLAGAPAYVVVLGAKNAERSHCGAAAAEAVARGALAPDGAAEVTARARARFAAASDADRAAWAGKTATLAAAALMAAAESLGVSAGWADAFDEPRLKRAFGVPEDHVVAGVVALGLDRGPGPFPGRFGLDEVAFDGHFGAPFPPDRPQTNE